MVDYIYAKLHDPAFVVKKIFGGGPSTRYYGDLQTPVLIGLMDEKHEVAKCSGPLNYT